MVVIPAVRGGRRACCHQSGAPLGGVLTHVPSRCCAGVQAVPRRIPGYSTAENGWVGVDTGLRRELGISGSAVATGRELSDGRTRRAHISSAQVRALRAPQANKRGHRKRGQGVVEAQFGAILGWWEPLGGSPGWCRLYRAG